MTDNLGRKPKLLLEGLVRLSLEPAEATAGHAERVSGHEGGVIRGQKGDRRRNAFGLTHHVRVDLLGPLEGKEG